MRKVSIFGTGDVQQDNSAAGGVEPAASAIGAAAAAAFEGGDTRRRVCRRDGGGVRGGVLLLPLRRGEFLLPGSVQGAGGAVPANGAETAAEENDKRRVVETHAPALLVWVLRRR